MQTISLQRFIFPLLQIINNNGAIYTMAWAKFRHGFESKVSGHYHSKCSICLLYFRITALWSDRWWHKMKCKPHSALLQNQCNQNGKSLDQTRMRIKPWWLSLSVSIVTMLPSVDDAHLDEAVDGDAEVGSHLKLALPGSGSHLARLEVAEYWQSFTENKWQRTCFCVHRNWVCFF